MSLTFYGDEKMKDSNRKLTIRKGIADWAWEREGGIHI